MKSHLAAITAVLSVSACSADPGVQVLVPADVEFSWKVAYNAEDDGLAAILPLDVLIYDALSGEAVLGAQIEVSGDQVAFVEADDVALIDPSDEVAWCDTCVWDAYRDEMVDIDRDDLVGGFDSLVMETDPTGLARVYAVVDAVAGAPGGFEPIHVLVRHGDAEQVFRLLPR